MPSVNGYSLNLSQTSRNQTYPASIYFDYDLHAMYADMKRSEDEHIAAGHPFVSPPSEFLIP
jgi:hypothetical protein